MRRNHGRKLFFSAKGAACLHLHDTNFLFGKAAKRHQSFVNVVRTLQRTPDGDSFLPIERCDDSIVFDVELLLRSGRVFTFHDVSSFLPDGLHVTFFNQIAFENVVAAPDDRGLLLAFCHSVHRRERLVLDGNRLDGLAKFVTICVGQEESRFFGMIDGLFCEARLVVEDQSDAIFPWNVFGCNCHKLFPRDTRAIGDFPDFAARNRAAHGCAVKHAGQNHVVHVARRPSDFVATFLAWNGRPDNVVLLQLCQRHPFARQIR